MRRDIGNELVVAIAAVAVLAFALMFGIILSLSSTNATPTPEESGGTEVVVIPSATIVSDLEATVEATESLPEPTEPLAPTETEIPATLIATAAPTELATEVATDSATVESVNVTSATGIETMPATAPPTERASSATATREGATAVVAAVTVTEEADVTETAPVLVTPTADIPATLQALSALATIVSQWTDTPSRTMTETATQTETPRPSDTATITATASFTRTPTDPPTETSSPTDTPPPTRTFTRTAVPSDTATQTETPLPTKTASATLTATPLPTDTLTPSRTPIPSDTATDRPTETQTPSMTPTATNTASATATRTASATVTHSNTPTQTASPTQTRSPTVTATPTTPPLPTAVVFGDQTAPTALALGTPVVPGLCVPPVGWTTYTVQAGDSLARIAQAVFSSVGDLRDANCLRNVDNVSAGSLLFVPFEVSDIFPAPTPQLTQTRPPLAVQGCTNLGSLIQEPLPGEEITGVFTVVGTAVVEGFQHYLIEVRPDGSDLYTYYTRADAPVVGGALAQINSDFFDPGWYWIRLTVVNSTEPFPEACAIPVIFR